MMVGTTEMAKKRIAVVGGGFCGLGSVLWSIKYGLDPVCFEKTSQVGGTWCYREESTPGVGSTMPTTILNHSKEVGAFSGYPPPAEYSNYMRHGEVYRYWEKYCEEENVLDCVKLNSEVISVKRTDNYQITGRWEVTVRNTVTDEMTTEVFDGVTVCVGHVNRPKMPCYPGQDRFGGKILHTHSLKRVHGYKGQNVVVVGMGCSALDAAVEISSVAKQVYLSTRSGAWVMNRVGFYGFPLDRYLMKRWMLTLLYYLPSDWVSYIVEKFYLDPNFDSSLYNVKPQHHFLSKDPTFNDHIHSKFISGSVIQKHDIDRFTQGGVIFHGEDNETPVDSVIMATGYTWKFPFLEEGVLIQENSRLNLYKCIYPSQLPHATLAILGFIFSFGPGIPVGEMQCRVAAHFMAGKKRLPSEDVMMSDVIERHRRNVKRYQVDDQKLSIRVDYLQFMDELSEMIGARPSIWKYFFTDFPLFWKMITGPVLPYQYRLEGPHKWEGAREAIITCDDRIKAGLMKLGVDSESKKMK